MTMSVPVDKSQIEFMRAIEDKFNEDYYMVENCSSKTRYSTYHNLMNLSMQVYKERSNCYTQLEQRIENAKLNNLKTPDIVINKIVDDTWEQTDW